MSIGVFTSKDANAAFRQLVGVDYDKFTATAGVIDSRRGDIDGQTVIIVNMFVLGV